jgi:hypothetical protein
MRESSESKAKASDAENLINQQERTMFENKLTFTQATERYHALFKKGKPAEKESHLSAGVWCLLNKNGDLLAWVYPDGSVLSGRMAAELFHR